MIKYVFSCRPDTVIPNLVKVYNYEVGHFEPSNFFRFCLHPERVFEDKAIAFPGGKAKVERLLYKQRDYFINIEVDQRDDKFTLTFNPILIPGRRQFWKDIIVIICKEMEELPGVSMLSTILPNYVSTFK